MDAPLLLNADGVRPGTIEFRAYSGGPKGIRPLFLHRACLRCCRRFPAGEIACVVRGGPNPRVTERGVAITVCQGCIGQKDVDVLELGVTWALDYPEGMDLGWPAYISGHGRADGHAILMKTDTHHYRIVLKGGHPRQWPWKVTKQMLDYGEAFSFSPDWSVILPVSQYLQQFRELPGHIVSEMRQQPLEDKPGAADPSQFRSVCVTG